MKLEPYTSFTRQQANIFCQIYYKISASKMLYRRHFKCMAGLTCIILFASLTLLIVIFMLISEMSYYQQMITFYSESDLKSIHCSEVCTSPHFFSSSSGDICCDSAYIICLSKSYCIKKEKDKNIIIGLLFSIVVLMIVLCIACKTCGQKQNNNQRQEQQNEGQYNPLGINQSISSQNSQQNRPSRRSYSSFVYSDMDSNCAICLQSFTEEKSILLPCGHLFHSHCIRDWIAVRQQGMRKRMIEE